MSNIKRIYYLIINIIFKSTKIFKKLVTCSCYLIFVFYYSSCIGINTKSESHDRSESNKVDRSSKIKSGGGALPDVLTMPCVSTKVEGPDGKKTQGFLYRYGKGEEVRIVCVCHGSFLTPSEFVKHGGGDDVDHPLRHIVVTPSLFS